VTRHRFPQHTWELQLQSEFATLTRVDSANARALFCWFRDAAPQLELCSEAPAVPTVGPTVGPTAVPTAAEARHQIGEILKAPLGAVPAAGVSSEEDFVSVTIHSNIQ
jgi:hypothetical protein